MNEFKRVFPSPPADWKQAQLSEFVDRVTTRNEIGDTNVLTISAEHGLISQQVFFNRRVASENANGYYRLRKGDFAYNKSYSKGYPVGAIRRLDAYESGIVSPLYICFRPRPECVDSSFLAFYLDGGAIDRQLADVAKEGARNHGLLNVAVSDFFAISTALPPIAEQRVIADALSSLDRTIHETEAIIAKLKAVKQGLLHDLLTRGIDDNGELRPPQAEAPHLYKQSALGWIPQQWTCHRICEVVAKDAPVTYGVVQPGPEVENGIPFVRGGDIFGGRILIDQLRTIGREVSNGYRRTILRGGELLMSLVGYPGEVGIVPLELSGANIARQAALIRLADSGSTEFVKHYLSSKRGKDQVLGHRMGSAQQVVNLSDLRSVHLPLPPAKERSLLVGRLEAADELIDNEQRGLAKLQVTRQGLMDDLLTGRVRVTPLLEPTKL